MSTFDPAQALRIDLAQGKVSLAGSGERVLVPVESLIDLLAASDEEAIRGFGASLGTDMGRRIVERLGNAVERASVELYVEHLGGELALTGLGCLSVERWGHALVVVIDGAKDSAAIETLLMALIEAVVQRSLSRDTAIVSLGRQGDSLKFALLGSHAKDEVEHALSTGKSYGDVLTSLHRATKALSSNRGEA